MKTGLSERQPAPSQNARSLPAALILGGVLFLLVTWSGLAPDPNLNPNPEASTNGRFSAAVARDTLAYLLGDQQPHPIGTAANRAVKERVIEKLAASGAVVTEQRALGCVPGATYCGFVENVIGTLQGEQDQTIVLMAHYDSTTNSPGAGDDGAGVATVLEVMRILALEGAPGRRYRNTVQAVITDGEEEGLFGAEAFFADHPDAKKTLVLINVEGSGTAGPSNLLRTSPGSGDLVRLYRKTAPHPMASSIATEIFKRMPNDTDFSVGSRAGVKGLDFAFAGERTHYHTPLDTIENLDLGTLQHHGDNVLPLIRELVEMDLDQIDGEYSYTTMLDVWVLWRESYSLPLAVLGVLFLLVGILLQRRNAPLLQTIRAIFASLAVLSVALLFCALALMLAARLAGTTPAWPGTTWPWRVLLVSGATFGWAAVGGFMARRLGFHPMLNGVWFWVAVMAVLLAAVAPLAASPFLVPLLVASTLKLALALVDRSGRSAAWYVVALLGALAGVVYLGGLVFLLEESQGYQLAPAFYVPLAFTLLLFTPMFALSPKRDKDSSRRVGRGLQSQRPQSTTLALVAGLGVIVGTIALLTTPLYTESRPQPVSLRYVQDLDHKTARWLVASYSPLPTDLINHGNFKRESLEIPTLPASGMVANAPYVPWQELSLGSSNMPAGDTSVQVLSEHASAEGRVMTLQLSSARQAGLLQLLVARDAKLKQATIAGRRIELSASRGNSEYDVVSIYAVPPEGVEVILELGSTEPHEHVLMDTSFELPEQAQPLRSARAPLAGPAHRGDRWMAMQRLRF